MSINKKNISNNNNLTEIQQALDCVRIGHNSISLTNYDNSTIPALTIGSIVEVAGALYKVESSNSTISTTDKQTSSTVSDGNVYIVVYPDVTYGLTISASFTATTPVWDTEKQGYYITDTLYRAIGECTKSGSNYTGKLLYLSNGIVRMNIEHQYDVHNFTPTGRYGQYTFTLTFSNNVESIVSCHATTASNYYNDSNPDSYYKECSLNSISISGDEVTIVVNWYTGSDYFASSKLTVFCSAVTA